MDRGQDLGKGRQGSLELFLDRFPDERAYVLAGCESTGEKLPLRLGRKVNRYRHVLSRARVDVQPGYRSQCTTIAGVRQVEVPSEQIDNRLGVGPSLGPPWYRGQGKERSVPGRALFPSSSEPGTVA